MTFTSIIVHSTHAQVDKWLLEAAGGTGGRFEFSCGSTNKRHHKTSLMLIKDVQGKLIRLAMIWRLHTASGIAAQCPIRQSFAEQYQTRRSVVGLS